MREHFKQECKIIQENCTYTAETHHILASDHKCRATAFQVIPAVVASLSSLLVVGKVIPAWWGWLTVISAVVSAVGNVLDPLKGYYDHLNAAKNFTVIKQRARALGETFSENMNDEKFGAETKVLHDQYNDLVRFVPPTTQKAFEKARGRIREGIHKPD